MPEAQPPDPQRALAILLGASQFPDCREFEGSESFSNLAGAMREYLTDADRGLGMPTDNVLDLFDSGEHATPQMVAIEEFLNAHLAEGASEIRDLLVYYVGHGGFEGSQYFLAIRKTRSADIYHSSVPVRRLSKVLGELARDLRKFVVLDACFAAAAAQEFQSKSLLDLVVRQTEPLFPSVGTALLCAASSTEAARVAPDRPLTMFSDALLETLLEGDPSSTESRLTLEAIATLTERRILRDHAHDAIRPEVHVPDQREGVIARIPLFPNPAAGSATSEQPRAAEPPRPPAGSPPRIAVSLEPDPEDPEAGDNVDWVTTVQNEGESELISVVVQDARTRTLAADPFRLEAGAEASHALRSGYRTAGRKTRTILVTAHTDSGQEVRVKASGVVVVADPAPALLADEPDEAGETGFGPAHFLASTPAELLENLDGLPDSTEWKAHDSDSDGDVLVTLDFAGDSAAFYVESGLLAELSVDTPIPQWAAPLLRQVLAKQVATVEPDGEPGPPGLLDLPHFIATTPDELVANLEGLTGSMSWEVDDPDDDGDVLVRLESGDETGLFYVAAALLAELDLTTPVPPWAFPLLAAIAANRTTPGGEAHPRVHVVHRMVNNLDELSENLDALPERSWLLPDAVDSDGDLPLYVRVGDSGDLDHFWLAAAFIADLPTSDDAWTSANLESFRARLDGPVTFQTNFVENEADFLTNIEQLSLRASIEVQAVDSDGDVPVRATLGDDSDVYWVRPALSGSLQPRDEHPPRSRRVAEEIRSLLGDAQGESVWLRALRGLGSLFEESN